MWFCAANTVFTGLVEMWCVRQSLSLSLSVCVCVSGFPRTKQSDLGWDMSSLWAPVSPTNEIHPRFRPLCRYTSDLYGTFLRTDYYLATQPTAVVLSA